MARYLGLALVLVLVAAPAEAVSGKHIDRFFVIQRTTWLSNWRLLLVATSS